MEKFKWLNQPFSFERDENGKLTIQAPAQTDFYRDYCTEYSSFNAPIYYTEISGDFTFKVKLKPEFKEKYDAAGLMVMENGNRWIKCVYEKGDFNNCSLITMINDYMPDDASEVDTDAENIYLMVVRKQNSFQTFYSSDGNRWELEKDVRFVLPKKIKVGLQVQSPAGEGCKAEFEDIQVINSAYEIYQNSTA